MIKAQNRKKLGRILSQAMTPIKYRRILKIMMGIKIDLKIIEE